MATPATTLGQRSAASTAQRESSRSQPIWTIRVTPTAAARAIASAGSSPDIRIVESRWQCESTTGDGNGSGASGNSTALILARLRLRLSAADAAMAA